MANVSISAADNRIVLNFDDLGSVMRVLSHWNNAFRRDDFTRRLQQTAETLGLDLEVQVQGRTLERFGPGNTAGILRRLMHQLARKGCAGDLLTSTDAARALRFAGESIHSLADAAGDARGKELVTLQPSR